MSLLIITSAAYIGSELAAEFGSLPPCFLPVGNKRLYEHQIMEMRHLFEKIILTLPENYHINSGDSRCINVHGADVLYVPENLTLGESISYTINILGLGDSGFSILHGDTLIRKLYIINHKDAYTIHQTTDSYNWAQVQSQDDGKHIIKDIEQGELVLENGRVLSGFFTFTSGTLFVKHITKAHGNFITALNYYSKERPLKKIRTGEWLDFGHLQTFYKSRHEITTQREFNNIHFNKNTVEKTSGNLFKMDAEAHWFESIPPELKIYTPVYIGRTKQGNSAGYKISSFNLTPLNDLSVFGQHNQFVWETIFAACANFLHDCTQFTPDSIEEVTEDAMHLYLEKTVKRLNRYESESDFDIHGPMTLNGHSLPSAIEIATRTAELIQPPAERHICVMHGDFCFSNIFFDFREQNIKVIDPRGALDNSKASIYGDTRYDIGKLYHSAIGFYDEIIAGNHRTSLGNRQAFEFEIISKESTVAMSNAFINIHFPSFSQNRGTIQAIAIHLFLSMLPLHSDNPNRQNAFIANAGRLFLDLDK